MEVSARSFIRFGWEAFKKRPWFYIGIAVLSTILYAVAAQLNRLPYGIGFIVGWIIDVFVGMGLIALFLKAHDASESATVGDLWQPSQFFRYFAVGLLTSAIVVVGLVLLIVPGIIFSLMFMFGAYLVIDRHMGPIEAMEESARITKGHRWMLLRFSILCALVGGLGILCLGVGVFVAMPVIFLATVHAYRHLAAQAGAMQESSQPTSSAPSAA